MVSINSHSDSQTVSAQADSTMNFSGSVQYNSDLSYGSETEENIDIKPTIPELFFKIETSFCEARVYTTDLRQTSDTKRTKIGVQRIECPLLVPKTEPASDTESSPENNLPQNEMDLIEDSILDDKTNLKIDQSEVESLLNSKSRLARKRNKVKKKNLTVSQMSKIIQNDSGFFSNKKKWMTKNVLRQLPNKDKIFLSNIFKKFMKRNKLEKKN